MSKHALEMREARELTRDRLGLQKLVKGYELQNQGSTAFVALKPLPALEPNGLRDITGCKG